MADTSFAVTAGSGTLLHTVTTSIGGSTVHDEVVKHGEPWLATYALQTAALTTATSASHLLQIMAGASLNLYIRRIVVAQTAAVTTAAIVPFSVIRLTTAGTGGTSITPATLDTTDTGAGATGMSLPTGKGTESTFIWSADAYLIQTIGASTPFTNPIIDLDFDRLHSKAIRIAAGTTNGLAVSNRAAAAGATVRVGMLFSEANF